MRQFIEVEQWGTPQSKSIININHIVAIKQEADHIVILLVNGSVPVGMSMDEFKKYAQITTNLDTQRIGF